MISREANYRLIACNNSKSNGESIKIVLINEGKSPYMFAYNYRSTGKGMTECVPNYYHCLPWEVRKVNVTNIWKRVIFLYVFVLLGL